MTGFLEGLLLVHCECHIKKWLQLSLCVHWEFVPGPAVNTKIRGCSSPIVGSLFLWVSHQQIQPASDHICEQFIYWKKICILVDLQQLKFMLFRISCLFSWLAGPTDWIDNLLISSNHWRPSLMICLWKMAHFQRWLHGCLWYHQGFLSGLLWGRGIPWWLNFFYPFFT